MSGAPQTFDEWWVEEEGTPPGPSDLGRFRIANAAWNAAESERFRVLEIRNQELVAERNEANRLVQRHLELRQQAERQCDLIRGEWQSAKARIEELEKEKKELEKELGDVRLRLIGKPKSEGARINPPPSPSYDQSELIDMYTRAHAILDDAVAFCLVAIGTNGQMRFGFRCEAGMEGAVESLAVAGMLGKCKQVFESGVTVGMEMKLA